MNSKIDLDNETDEGIRQKVFEAVRDKHHDLSDLFSELRKSGKDLGVLNYKLMMVPLKIKMFLSTYEKKDLDILVKKIKEIDDELKKVKK
jgi:hypothetical protein